MGASAEPGCGCACLPRVGVLSLVVGVLSDEMRKPPCLSCTAAGAGKPGASGASMGSTAPMCRCKKGVVLTRPSSRPPARAPSWPAACHRPSRPPCQRCRPATPRRPRLRRQTLRGRGGAAGERPGVLHAGTPLARPPCMPGSHRALGAKGPRLHSRAHPHGLCLAARRWLTCTAPTRTGVEPMHGRGPHLRA